MTVPFHVTVRQNRRLVHELIVDAPNIKAVRPVLRSYMASKGLQGRASWRLHPAPEVIPARLERIDWQWHPPLTATRNGERVQVPWPREAQRRLTDRQRRRVYNADVSLWPADAPSVRGIPHNFEQRRFLTLSEVQFYVNEVTEAAGAKPIIVVPTRGKRNGKARYANRSIIMPSWTWFEQYVLHEIAHHLTGDKLGDGYRWCTLYESHGPEFVATLHRLTLKHMGEPAATAYEQACRRFGVRGCPRLGTGIVLSTLPSVHEVPLAAGNRAHPRLPTADDFIVPATPTKTEQGYQDSYRRYKRGERSSAPSLRKGMTKQRGAELRAAIDNEVL